MSTQPPTDAWDRPITISNGLFQYRNRAIDILTFAEVRLKGKRVLINHYKENKDSPRAIIVCANPDAAKVLYDYIVEKVYPPLQTEMSVSTILSYEAPTLWSFLGCRRRA